LKLIDPNKPLHGQAGARQCFRDSSISLPPDNRAPDSVLFKALFVTFYITKKHASKTGSKNTPVKLDRAPVHRIKIF
jgi:hypothetical protein